MNVQDWDITSSGQVKKTMMPKDAGKDDEEVADAIDDFGYEQKSGGHKDAITGRVEDFMGDDSSSDARVKDEVEDDLDSPGMRLDLCEDFCDDGVALQRQTTVAVSGSSTVEPSGLSAHAELQKRIRKKLSVVYEKSGMRLVSPPGCASQPF